MSSLTPSGPPSPVTNVPVTKIQARPSVPQRILRALTWERWLLLLILLGGGGYGLWQWLGPKGPPAGMGGGPPAGMQGPPPRPVVTTSLQPGTAAQAITVLGQVEANESATLRSQTSGTVQELRVSEGDRIREGEVVAELDKADQFLAQAQAQAELAEAQSLLAELKSGTRREVVIQRQAEVQAEIAREAEARDNLNRIQNLVAEGALAERQLIEARTALDSVRSDRLAAEAALADAQAGPRADEIEAEEAKVAAAQAAVTQANLALQRTQVRATSSGVVSDRLVSVGDYVSAADPLIELIDNDIVDITLELPEGLAGQVQPGLPVQLSSRAIPGWQTTATVDALLPVASAASRRRPARIRLASPPEGLLPGTAVIAQFEQPGNSSGYQVSRDALTRRAGQWFVFGVRNGEGGQLAEQIEVTLVSDLGETVVIESPELSPQQTIVLKGGDGLMDEAPIMVVEGPDQAPPPGGAPAAAPKAGPPAAGPPAAVDEASPAPTQTLDSDPELESETETESETPE